VTIYKRLKFFSGHYAVGHSISSDVIQR